MNAYELVLITKDEKENAVKSVMKLLEDQKSKITKNEQWGKKVFEYPIKKATTGYYHLLQFEADKGIIQDFKKKLDYNEDVLRYLLLTL